ncbi:hypothetical protein VNI00_017936 [Paramarasmius palmivorus]|uniref:Uncharacterized protein n=1 Tax=Paramarasmius palmivorus TaxID=297713 RepID=A0AAW0B191_9AGAR
MLDPLDLGSIESFDLYYDLQPGTMWDSFLESRLSQAHAIFRQLGIREDDWEQYAALSHVQLVFRRNKDATPTHSDWHVNTTLPIYLFIRPVPRPSDDGDKWNVWLKGTKYYWAFDASGKRSIRSHERLKLGLPLFDTAIQVWHQWWDCDAHSAIQMVNHHKGFNPTSLDLARSFGCQIFEIIDGSMRSEEVKEDDQTKDATVILSNSGTHPTGTSVHVDPAANTYYDDGPTLVSRTLVPCRPTDAKAEMTVVESLSTFKLKKGTRYKAELSGPRPRPLGPRPRLAV